MQNSTISGRHGDIKLRIYKPYGEAVLPAVVFFHGSGFCVLDLDSHDEICRLLCLGARCVVVSVDYGLAPELPYPRGTDDSLDATKWVADNAAALSIDAEKIVLAGDSAGGNMAVVSALRLRDEGRPLACGLLLFYPVTDHYNAQYPSYTSFETGFGLTANTMRWFWDMYLDDRRVASQAYVSPGRAHLHGLPPTHVQTAEFDVLRDEAEAFVKRLQESSVQVTWTRAYGLNHGYLRWAAEIDEARTKMSEACEWLLKIWGAEAGQ